MSLAGMMPFIAAGARSCRVHTCFPRRAAVGSANSSLVGRMPSELRYRREDGSGLVLQLYLTAIADCSLFIVTAFGFGLVPASPARPAQYFLGRPSPL